ncbi:hypothetical protein HBH75_109840 [Parastagonospora nodorum]|nr:hypothetical protein HBH75_109840 [Parastagonospora nodorum]
MTGRTSHGKFVRSCRILLPGCVKQGLQLTARCVLTKVVEEVDKSVLRGDVGDISVRTLPQVRPSETGKEESKTVWVGTSEAMSAGSCVVIECGRLLSGSSNTVLVKSVDFASQAL